VIFIAILLKIAGYIKTASFRLPAAWLTSYSVDFRVPGWSGAFGAAASFTKVLALAGVEAAPQPPSFPALTVKVYSVLGKRSLMVAGEAVTVLADWVPPATQSI
jgi:hypothetical protein